MVIHNQISKSYYNKPPSLTKLPSRVSDLTDGVCPTLVIPKAQLTIPLCHRL